MKRFLLTVVALACTAALAKLPAPVLDDAAKAKAAEAAAKTAWQAKVDAFQLCKAQDKAVAAYRKGTGVAVNSKDVKPAAMTAATPAAPPAAPPAAAASAAAVPAAAAASGTPVAVAAPTIPPCAEPGPFAYSPPEQKPLEAAGAHSPASNATSPPSNAKTSAEMAPAKPATAQSKKP